MGKFIGYTLLTIIIILALEWFRVVDIPYLDIPDYTSGKTQGLESTQKALDQMK
ncbi:hypothetical protein DSCW_50970 [Desulfosarcina widdelii]|uniref:Uncharacterized protein n=1 Tax=Desulfosarcina widdelii TaxID=947919 RepID=A0A5K7ZA66_9BACT|nr:hypothetical protein DSCW_50970 [Desulfosarcina widdelii]